MGAVASAPRVRLSGPRRILKLRSDATLADRFQAGDEAAFAVLYERHQATVLAVCMGVLGSRHDAEDAAQETFAALAVALRSDPPVQMRGWLARVARNASIDLARRRRERAATGEQLGEPATNVTSGKAELETVLAGVRELPESQRTALLMRELAGHSYAEIAGLLGTDEDGVRGLIARARVGLRNYREATELPCTEARAALAAEPDRRRLDKTARRHLRSCPSCRAYQEALRSDARALRGLSPLHGGGGLLGGGAAAGLAAKAALVGVGATQVTAACAVSVCALGGFVFLYEHGHGPPGRHIQARLARAASSSGAASPLAPSTAGGPEATQAASPRLFRSLRSAPSPAGNPLLPGVASRAASGHVTASLLAPPFGAGSAPSGSGWSGSSYWSPPQPDANPSGWQQPTGADGYGGGSYSGGGADHYSGGGGGYSGGGPDSSTGGGGGYSGGGPDSSTGGGPPRQGGGGQGDAGQGQSWSASGQGSGQGSYPSGGDGGQSQPAYNGGQSQPTPPSGDAGGNPTPSQSGGSGNVGSSGGQGSGDWHFGGSNPTSGPQRGGD